ncbi:MAG TPA: FAD-binding oxidoreductase [Blastocatellia bacterium]|jgi:sarcosine oxidase subunit beta|nr:FAD-binding oxidoreductase [Blastocatellia bacterium]
MAATADVVIIGGGIVGSSIAYHLAESGCADVLIIEREEKQGLGSTSKSMGGVRAQFATSINIQMSLYSIDLFSRFEEVTGQTADYRAHGYLFCATTEAHLKYLRENQEKQKAFGLKNVEMVSREDIVKMVPQMIADDIIGGAYCPTDGFVDPHGVMTGFAKRAKELGARTLLNTTVTGVTVENGAVTGVKTSNGEVSTRNIVNAAGPWAAAVAEMAGVELPVTPLRRQIVKTQRCDFLPAKFPMVIDMSTGLHFRREGEAILMAWPDDEETHGFKTAFTHDFLEKVLTLAVDRVPLFADLPVNPKQCWAGMYEVSPDHHAIIGQSPEVKGLFFANGFSGHGVMHSPASGRITADLILGRRSFVDPAPLGIERFAEGRLLEETAVL